MEVAAAGVAAAEVGERTMRSVGVGMGKQGRVGVGEPGRVGVGGMGFGEKSRHRHKQVASLPR